MTFASCYTGIGGFDCGLSAAGWACRWQADADPSIRAQLAVTWPAARQFGSADEALAAASPADLLYAEPAGTDDCWARLAAVAAVCGPWRWLVLEGRPDTWTQMRQPGDVLVARGWRVAYRVLRYVTAVDGQRSAARQRVLLVASMTGDPGGALAAAGIPRETPLTCPTGFDGTADESRWSTAALARTRGIPWRLVAALPDNVARAGVLGACAPAVGHRLGQAIREADRCACAA